LARRIVAAVVFALVVVVFVVVRVVDRTEATTTVVAGPPDPVLPTVMHAKPTRYTVVPTPITGSGRIYLQVGTYLEQPEDAIVLDVRDASGARIARCVFPPASYTDNGQLRCPLADISRARSLIVTRRGTAKIALYGHGEQAGFLVKNEARSLVGRVSTVLSRIAVPLPNGVGSSALLVGLFGSVALTVFALLLAVRFEPSTRGPDRHPHYADQQPRDDSQHGTTMDQGPSDSGQHSSAGDSVSPSGDSGDGADSGGGGSD
jgi:uncharacterized membrane protein YgcG